jgi:hypothetical protein
MNPIKSCYNRLSLPTLIVACMVLFSLTSVAQTCETRMQFPQPGDKDIHVFAGHLCLTNTANDGHVLFLRFVDQTSKFGFSLRLFDHTDGGKTLWCAHAPDGTCAVGEDLVFHQNGNLSLNFQGAEIWNSNTRGDNNGHEFLKVTTDGLACVVTNNTDGTQTRDFCSNNTPR